MSYAQKDRSIEESEPVEFYRFHGPFGEFRYTSDPVPQTCDGLEYQPLPITRTSVETGSVVDTIMTMDFTIPADDQLARLYCYKRTPEMMTVEVRRAHRGDDWSTDFKVEWVGFSLDTSVSGRWATIRTGSLIQAYLKRNVANLYYQRLCNHVLFDARCQIDRAAWTMTATITKVQNQLVTVDNDGTGNGELKAGEIVVTRTGEARGIYDNQNNIVTISYPFVDVEVGDEVELVFGCDHKRLGHCKARFNNVSQYGGFDFIPVVNPFTDLNFDAKVTETVKEAIGWAVPLPFAD